jgi:PAS domain S-box-containing protein
MPDMETEANQKLSVLLNLYRSFIDTTFEMVFRTNRDGKILFANRLFTKLFGFANYKVAKESNVKDLFDDREDFLKLILKLDEEKRVSSVMIHFKRIDGEKIIGLLNGSVTLDSKGNNVLNWAMLDVTAQANAERILKESNDELAKVNHQMEKFLYSTSHDLRSPLTSIFGLVNLIRMENPPPLMVDYTGKIEKSALKLDKIIKDIMSFSKSTYQRSSSEKIDFETLVWKSINHFQADPSFRKINFEVKYEGSFPFFGDTERIEIILENVFRNCVHFYDANKSRPFVKVNINSKKENAFFEIIDNGVGIGQQHMDQIFNMFYKASHLSKGAGLGLFIVKETLEKIKGNINIESEIGFGTVARINIPNDHKGILISRKLELQHQNQILQFLNSH